MPEVAGALPEGTDGITLVVINCGPSSQDGGSQKKTNNGGVAPAKVFKLAMRAFHAEVAILPQTAVVFLVSEPFSNTKGTLSRLIPERRSACCVSSKLVSPRLASEKGVRFAYLPKIDTTIETPQTSRLLPVSVSPACNQLTRVHCPKNGASLV